MDARLVPDRVAVLARAGVEHCRDALVGDQLLEAVEVAEYDREHAARQLELLRDEREEEARQRRMRGRVDDERTARDRGGAEVEDEARQRRRERQIGRRDADRQELELAVRRA